MGASTTLASTQAIVIWTMLVLLLAWMVTFAVLAFRPHTKDLDQSEQRATSSHALPVSPASTILHVIASQPAQLPAKPIETRRHDTTGEMEAISAM